MKAIVLTKSGPPEVLKLQQLEKPAPQETEVLVRITAATVTAGDVMLRALHPLLYIPLRLFGVRKKKILGHEFAGQIESVGRSVTLFKAGDPVFGTTTALNSGSYAEYICLSEDGMLVIKPDNVTFEEAAAVPVGGMTALQILRQGNIQSGQNVLIYGASGSVGTYAVQLARYFGASVTGVCSTSNLEWVQALGADRVIDYTKQDFTKSSQIYDLIFDAVGKSSPSESKRVLAENGSFVSIRSSTSENLADLGFLRDLLESGKLKAVIDRRFPLEQISEAHRYVEQGHKKGNVVLILEQGHNQIAELYP